ncbi:MAG: hypothetical protein Q8M20_01300 [Rhodocyclaceae bacterium]|nr:hypothetical protein [Rhodocyclaceae bacterium]MDZ4214868.1 hypothetical protein [Rhodocyclaceae bacterium]
MIQIDHPCISNIEMAEIGAVDSIEVQRNRMMSMDFGTVMVPVAAMLMRPRQMRMRRRPLHRQEDGQQDKRGRGAKVLLEQEDGHTGKTAHIVSRPNYVSFWTDFAVAAVK